jgi:hypothetical protein
MDIAAREQDDQHVAIPPQIDAVARPKINPEFKNPCPTDLTFERFPSSIRAKAVATRARATASNDPNHSANGLSPVLERKYRSSSIG